MVFSLKTSPAECDKLLLAEHTHLISDNSTLLYAAGNNIEVHRADVHSNHLEI